MESSQGKNVVVDWNEALHRKCRHADTEVHYGGAAYRGKLDSIHELVAMNSTLAVKLTSVMQIHPHHKNDEMVGDQEFLLTKCHRPLSIKDAEYDCLHISCKEGRMAIYFRRPPQRGKHE